MVRYLTSNGGVFKAARSPRGKPGAGHSNGSGGSVASGSSGGVRRFTGGSASCHAFPTPAAPTATGAGSAGLPTPFPSAGGSSFSSSTAAAAAAAVTGMPHNYKSYGDLPGPSLSLSSAGSPAGSPFHRNRYVYRES